MNKNKIKEALRPVVKEILNEVDDSTEYELDLGGGKKFSMNKKKKTFSFGKETISLAEFQKIVNFAKKNGGIK